jgi:PadR family transcriptional regulator, regulatory protein PadR
MQRSEPPELLPGTLYMMILRTLTPGPLHGYAVARRIKAASKDGLEIEEGSLYPALNRMLVKGWLTATMRKSYGFRTYRVLELALYHSLGKLPEPESTHDFF